MACKTSLAKLFPEQKIQNLVIKPSDEVVVIWAKTTVSLHGTRCKLTVFDNKSFFSKRKVVKVSLVLL